MANKKLLSSASINQALGINAHLNDALQDDGDDWQEFHGRHIGHLQDALNEELIPKGYVARAVPGLQIRHETDDRWRNPEPDITILDEDTHRRPQLLPPGSGSGKATAVMTIPAALGRSDEDYLTALALYELKTKDHHEATPIALLELLSPTNKPLAHKPNETGTAPQDRDWHRYDEKRLTTLGNGTILIEVDYLDQTLPIPGLTPYHPIPDGKESHLHPREGDPDAGTPYPFYIAVSNPHQRTDQAPYGITTVTGFGLETPMPKVTIPLRQDDFIILSFQAAYDNTVALPHIGRRIDYAQLPTHFNEHRATEQDAIAARMKTLFQADRDHLLTEDQETALPLAYPIQGARLDLAQVLVEFQENKPAPTLDIGM